MSNFLSTEIPRPLRRRLSRSQLRLGPEDQEDEPLLKPAPKQQQMENYVKEKLKENARVNLPSKTAGKAELPQSFCVYCMCLRFQSKNTDTCSKRTFKTTVATQLIISS